MILDNYQRAPTYVDRILKGAKPSELPVQLPVKFEMTINLNSAIAHEPLCGLMSGARSFEASMQGVAVVSEGF